MLRVFSTLIFLLLFVLLVWFWMENYPAFDTLITIKYNFPWLKVDPTPVPVWSLLLLMLTAGFIVTFFLELGAWLKSRSINAEQDRQIRKLQKELQDLQISGIETRSEKRLETDDKKQATQTEELTIDD